MKKYLSILLALMLVNITLLVVNPTEVKADDQQQTSNVDVVIVIDNSGSMDAYTYDENYNRSNNTKWEDAVIAASDFIDQLHIGDRCAIFCFESNTANYSYDYNTSSYNYENGWGSDKPRQLNGFVYTKTAGKTDLKNNLSSLEPYFSTPLFDTIGAAMDYVVGYKRSNSVGAIVALTDGEDNICNQFYPSHDYKEKKNVTQPSSGYYSGWGPNPWRYGLLNCSEATFIIGLGIEDKSEYQEQLEEISESSSGQYYNVTDSSELGSIYDQIAQKIDEKRDDGSKEESFLEQWLIPLIILITVSAVIVVLLAVLLRKKKTPPYAQRPVGGYQQPQQQQQAPPPAAGVCPTCGKPTRFIQQYNRYWCDSCQQYK
jgi:hypothetical protein